MNMATNVIQQFMDRNELRNTKPEVVAWMALDAIRLGFYCKIMKKEENIEPILKAQMDILLRGVKN